jgi:glycosyltransferase involved in cell wall biosynthesis
MRIAYVVPAYPPLASQPFVVNEMVEVQEAGHTLVIVPLYPGGAEATEHGTFARLRPAAVLPTALWDGRSCLLALWVLVRHPRRVVGTLLGLHAAAGRHLFAHLRLAAVTPKALASAWRLRRAGVERIHAHFATQTADCAAVAASVSGIPFSFTAHAYDIYSRVPRLRNATLGWKLRHAVQVIAVNDFGADYLRRHLPAEDAGRVQTVYVGIPMELFRTHPPPPSPREGTLRLLSVARFVSKKGLDTLLDAAALLRRRGVTFTLRVFGDGPLRSALEAQLTRLGLESLVALGGAISQERVAREMQACHAFVLPCRQDPSGDMDGIPTVFMEAMATGRPVVSCPVSGIPELVRDGETGLLVPPNDAEALASAIARLAMDDALRLRLGAHGRKLVERQHDQRLNARRLIELIATDPGGGRSGAAARSLSARVPA